MSAPVVVRHTGPGDFAGIIEMTRRIYPEAPPWTTVQLTSHLERFPEGQFVAECESRIVGMSASLIVLWDDYQIDTAWRDLTAAGTFANHDPERGRTLYGAEVMVDPAMQGRGVGSRLYEARRELVVALGLRRIRAGARLRGFHRYAGRLSPQEYVARVEQGLIRDATLSFQLHHGFHVIAVVSRYLLHDPESLGHAAVIEWINPDYAEPLPD